MKTRILSTFIMAAFGCQLVMGITMEANINMEGVTGKVSFMRNAVTAANADVTVELTGAGNYDRLELRTFPAVFGREKTAEEVCSSGIGPNMKNISNAVNTTLTGVAESEYFHRSILLWSSTDSSIKKICATILPSTVTSYRAKFLGPVAGTVWLRYTAGIGTLVYGNLYYVDGRSTDGTGSVTMYAQGSVDDTQAFANRCGNITGTSTTVVADVNVKTDVTDDGTFASFNSAIVPTQISVAVTSGVNIISCATLRMVSTKSVTSKMDWAGVEGYFTFTQNSPFDKTVTSMDLSGLNQTTSGYHVHKFPVAQRLSESENPCSGEFVSGHFNPYSVDASAGPSAGSSTNDKYEIGDLSGKYGTLASKDTFTASFDDWNLPLWGPNSIVGRSMVIHNSDGSRLMCGSIGYPETVTTGIVIFKAPVYGKMYFRQDESNPDEDTSVFLELANQDKTVTVDHNWHVHVYPVNEDAYAATGVCASAGGHYNPSGVNLDEPYSIQCRVENPLRCELGDLSNRIGKINVVATQRTTDGKYFFTDEYLPLSGAFSVLGRSVVVHGPSAASARFACANITQLHPAFAQTDSVWKGTEGAATGTFTMQQDTEFDVTKVSGSFTGLASLASGYHIHQHTISSSAASGEECGAASVAGHYNPFGWAVSDSIPVNGTFDQYEVGDTSNKYGLLDGVTTHVISGNTMDTNLPLFTFLSSSDKSIVIHKAEAGARWKCSNLYAQPPTGSNGYVISSTVTFSKDVTGTIKLRQVVYEDGGAGLTSYVVDVSPLSGNANTLAHNWHIHIDPITDQSSCGAASGHYDPYGAADRPGYSNDCKKTNPLFCEVGDISKKQEQYDIGEGRKSFNDVDTPLHTAYTVLGRSIVFHVAGGGADRYTCANIIPDDFTYTISYPSSADTTFNRYDFTKVVAEALGIARMRVVVLHNVDVPVVRNGCANVMIHIVGGGSVASKISDLLDGTLTGLGKYAPSSCSSKEGATMLGQKSDTFYIYYPELYYDFHWFHLHHIYGSFHNFFEHYWMKEPVYDTYFPQRFGWKGA